MKEELFSIDKNGNIKHWMIETIGNIIYVRYGRYLGKMQEKVTYCQAKNEGRANERSPEEQAILEATSKWKKQIDKCYRPTIEEAQRVGEVLPMLAHNFLSHGNRISFPCYVSPKLDGVRCIATVDGSSVTLTSRTGKEFDCPDHICEDLEQLSYLTGIKKFDGELYTHGTPLQNIVGTVMKPNTLTKRLQYHIFDLPSGDVWEDRLQSLRSMKKLQRFDSLNFVDCILVDSKAAASILLEQFMKDGYEGLMLRNINGKYEYNYRSLDLQKWKVMQDLEAKVVDVNEDKNGEGVLICEFKSDTYGWLQFKCKIRGTHEERLYHNQTKLIGKWITVIYQQFTEDGVPQFPVGLCVRECNSAGEPSI